METKMQLLDNAHIVGRGEVEIHRSVGGGQFQHVETDDNLIVRTVRNTVIQALAGNDVGHVTHMKFGTTGTPPAATVDDFDNSDASAIIYSFLAADIVITGETATFVGRLDEPTGNGGGSVVYTEVTLHAQNDTLVARYLFNNPQPKDASIALQIPWTIGYF